MLYQKIVQLRRVAVLIFLSQIHFMMVIILKGLRIFN